MSKRTIALIAILLISTIGLFVLALNAPSSKPVKNTMQNIVTPPLEQTTLSFGTLSSYPSTSSAKITTYSLPVEINTGSNSVTAVQLELQYDPEVLENVAIQAGAFFTAPQVLFNDVSQEAGRVSVALAIPLNGKGKIGTGTVATLTFSAKSNFSTKTSITFVPKSLVTAEGTLKSVLKSSEPIQITVGGSAK